MTYTARTNIPLVAQGNHTPQAVFELDTGDLVAIQFTSARTPQHSLACKMVAWQVEQDGTATPVDDDDGVVLVALPYNVDIGNLDKAGGLNAVAAAMLALVLGEPPPDPQVIKWRGEVIVEASIRNAIAVARAMTETVDLAGG